MKTRKMMVLLIGLCSIVCVQAQVESKNALRVGVNAAFWGMGDVVGASVYGEYERELLPFMSVVPRVSTGHSYYNGKGLSSLLASHTASLSLRFTPFPWEIINRLKLDVGFLYQHTADIHINYSTNASNPVVNTHHYAENLTGLLFGVNINLLQTGRHILGIRGEMLTSFVDSKFCCDGLQAGLFYGVRF